MYRIEQVHPTNEFIFYTSQMTVYERIMFEQEVAGFPYTVETGKTIIKLLPEELSEIMYNISLITAKPICYKVIIHLYDEGSEIDE